MGLFSGIKKAFKKVTKPFRRASKSLLGGVLGDTPKVQNIEPQAVAAPVETPDKDRPDEDTGEETGSTKRKTKRSAKGSLTVARNSRGGINI